MADEPRGFERMRAGEPYAMPDPDLFPLMAMGKRNNDLFNSEPDGDKRNVLLQTMLGGIGPHTELRPPVTWEFGKYIFLGNGLINFECVFMDGADIRIGDGCLIGPRCQFLTAGHPIRYSDRARFDEAGHQNGAYTVRAPVTIGAGCWLGASVIVCPGVSIGDRTTIGAGSIVTKDIPADVFAAGNPCRVIRELEH